MLNQRCPHCLEATPRSLSLLQRVRGERRDIERSHQHRRLTVRNPGVARAQAACGDGGGDGGAATVHLPAGTRHQARRRGSVALPAFHRRGRPLRAGGNKRHSTTSLHALDHCISSPVQRLSSGVSPHGHTHGGARFVPIRCVRSTQPCRCSPICAADCGMRRARATRVTSSPRTATTATGRLAAPASTWCGTETLPRAKNPSLRPEAFGFVLCPVSCARYSSFNLVNPTPPSPTPFEKVVHSPPPCEPLSVGKVTALARCQVTTVSLPYQVAKLSRALRHKARQGNPE